MTTLTTPRTDEQNAPEENAEITTLWAWIEKFQNDLAHELRRHDAEKKINARTLLQKAHMQLESILNVSSKSSTLEEAIAHQDMQAVLSFAKQVAAMSAVEQARLKLRLREVFASFPMREFDDLLKAEYKREQEETLRVLPSIHSLPELMSKHLPEVKWILDNILPEGLTMLCGKPKLGKSWLALGISLAVASGGYALGKIKVEQGEVLHLALEDTERRLQDRIEQLQQGTRGPIPDTFYYSLTWPRLDAGGTEQLENWLQAHPHTRLVVVDTWARVSPRPQGRPRGVYTEEYDSLVPLKALSDKYHVSILILHHLRKQGAEDVIDEINGSTGQTASVDGFLVLKKDERAKSSATLDVIGRDVVDAAKMGLSQDKVFANWILEAEIKTLAKTEERQTILDLLRNYQHGLTAREIAEHLEKNYRTTRNLLAKMVKEGNIIHEDEHFSVVTVVTCSHQRESVVTVVTVVTQEEQEEMTTANHDNHSDYSDYTSEQVVSALEPLGPLGHSHNGHIPTQKKPERIASWLVPGTKDWDKLVERVGLQEAQERRQCWVDQHAS